MNQKTRRRTIMLLFWIVSPVLVVDGGLRALDPWGALRYFGDLSALYSAFKEAPPRTYALLTGVYRFSTWTASITDDGYRRTPGSVRGACRVAFLGDSVTFGHGVDDGATWVNGVAQRLAIDALNTGVDGYNIDDVYAAYRAIRADAYVYLLIGNDADPSLDWQHADRSQHAAILSYLYVLDHKQADPSPGALPPPFADTLGRLVGDKRLLVVGIEDDALARLSAERYPAIKLIPRWAHTNSFADPHPDAAGSAEIAAAMTPIVREAVARVCNPII